MNDKNYYVYIMASKPNGTIYTGITNDLARRVWEHKNNFNPSSFTSRYNVKMLVYYEHTDGIYGAVTREKQIKAGSRKKKTELIESLNPQWNDLFHDIL